MYVPRLNSRARALDILDDLLVELAIDKTHIGSEGGVGHPLGGCPGGGLLHHAVDLLESEALGLGDEEERVDEAAGAEGTPDEEDLCAEVGLVFADHVGGDDGDDL